MESLNDYEHHTHDIGTRESFLILSRLVIAPADYGSAPNGDPIWSGSALPGPGEAQVGDHGHTHEGKCINPPVRN